MTHQSFQLKYRISSTNVVVVTAEAVQSYYNVTDQHQATSQAMFAHLVHGGAEVRPTFDLYDRPKDNTNLQEHQKTTYWKTQWDRTNVIEQISSHDSLASEL